MPVITPSCSANPKRAIKAWVGSTPAPRDRRRSAGINSLCPNQAAASPTCRTRTRVSIGSVWRSSRAPSGRRLKASASAEELLTTVRGRVKLPSNAERAVRGG